MVKAANAIRKREHSNSASGPDYFGFSNATIAKMIQDLPDVDKCSSYIMQRFEEPSLSSTKTSSEKRKASALGSNSKSGDNDNEAGDQSAAEDDDADEGDGDEDVDDDSYTTLGTPGKKKKVRLSSPSIRQTGFSVNGPGDSKAPETVDTSMEGDETHSEDDPEDWESKRSKPRSAPVGTEAAVSGGTKSTDHGSELDVGMDEDGPATPKVRKESERMATEEDPSRS